MALTPSISLDLGFQAPDFTLLDTVSGKKISLKEYKSSIATVIMFICNHCPFVKHVNSELIKLANDYIHKGISFIAISSNDATKYPEDSPEKMTLHAKELGYPFPYLYDEDQQVAKNYQAECTPEFYVFDKNLSLAYHGQLDSSRPSNDISLTGKDMRSALNHLLKNEPITATQLPSIGCNIKWKN